MNSFLLSLVFLLLLEFCSAVPAKSFNLSLATTAVRKDIATGCSLYYRTYDGTCNNLKKKSLGSAHTGHLRLVKLSGGAYDDHRPGARLLSNLLLHQKGKKLNQRGMTEMVTFWGQFIDHDIVETPSDPSKPFPIPIPPNDKTFARITNSESKHLKFFRSKTILTARGLAPLNLVSSYIDGSAIYGDNKERADLLRTFSKGQMLMEKQLWLPRNVEQKARVAGAKDSSRMFLAGDIRANENPVLAAIHTLFVREHNHLAREIAHKFPHYDDERVFQEARKINIAQVQAITYREFLPAMLGQEGSQELEVYKYSDKVDPSITDFFSTAAFRVGHSLIRGNIQRYERGNKRLAPLSLRDIFFKPDVLPENGVHRFIRGAINSETQDVDLQIVSNLRNFLFTNVEDVDGFDLGASNIQRGRDHRLPSYNDARAAFNLPRRKTFGEITSNVEVAKALKHAYKGKIEDVDAWVGGLAEDHVWDSSLGELFFASWVHQFKALRDGDRFFYTKKGLFSEEMTKKIPRIRRLLYSDSVLRDILIRNTQITRKEIPGDLFIKPSDNPDQSESPSGCRM